MSEETISRWLAGERAPGDERHMAECPECRAELARMETVLSGFRGAVNEWTARQAGSERPASLRLEQARHAQAVRRASWAVATAATLVLLAVPAWKDARDKRLAAETARADALLLERVNFQVSRPVPTSLEPLLKMFASEGNRDGQGDVDMNQQMKEGDMQ
jgi:hypothetical protein